MATGRAEHAARRRNARKRVLASHEVKPAADSLISAIDYFSSGKLRLQPKDTVLGVEEYLTEAASARFHSSTARRIRRVFKRGSKTESERAGRRGAKESGPEKKQIVFRFPITHNWKVSAPGVSSM
jgi:hypothetical protein